MKNSIKIVGLIALGAASAGDSVNLNSEEMLNIEINTPDGVTINNKGEVIDDGTKAMIDVDRPVGGTSIRYYSSAASAMNAIYSNDYHKVNYGCRAGTGYTVNVNESIDIPEGSKIVSLTVYGEDNSSSDMAYASLSGYNILDDWTKEIIVEYNTGTSAMPGKFSIGGFLDYKLTGMHGLLIYLHGGENITLCGFRIGYVPPDVADDIIFVNNFYR